MSYASPVLLALLCAALIALPAAAGTVPPVASFSAAPTTGDFPLAVQFTDTSTGQPTGWAWYFGDETYTTTPWSLQNASAGWSARSGHAAVTLPDGSIVIMGGQSEGGDRNDVWRSTDKGTTWTRLNTSAGWSPRYSTAAVTLPDGSILLMGGREYSNGAKNDVWRSADGGATWTCMRTGAEWSPREGHAVVALSDGSILLMGGFTGTGPSNEIWRSTDGGATWALRNASPGWPARWGHAITALPDGSVVLMGGRTSSPLRDVWRSTDQGRTWTLQTGGAPWDARWGLSCVVLPDGSILLMGGDNASIPLTHDVWRSTDAGASWTQVTGAAPWDARFDHASVVLPDGSVVITGGNVNPGSIAYWPSNDVWRLDTASSHEQHPRHVYAGWGAYSVTLRVYNAGYSTARKPGYIKATNGYIGQWGIHGEAPGAYSEPRGLAVDRDGNVVVAVSDRSRVDVYAPNGTYLHGWDGSGSGQSFSWPYDVEVDRSNNVLVADTNRVAVFDPAGSFLRQWGGAGELNTPFGVAIGPDGTVYVADTMNNRIRRFAANGTPLETWSGPGGLSYPQGIAVNASGYVYVADRENHRVLVYTANGTFVRQWSGALNRPQALAVAPSGAVFVADSGNRRVQVFDPSGGFIAAWGSAGTGDGQFMGPCGIVVDTTGIVYVSDVFPSRIQAFQRSEALPAVRAVPPGAAPPTDPDGNGKYEDINGNGRKDFADVVLYFNQMSWIAANEPVQAFDYNGNGRIDFADVVRLFNHL